MKTLNNYILEKLVLKKNLNKENPFFKLRDILRKDSRNYKTNRKEIFNWFDNNKEIFPESFTLTIVHGSEIHIGKHYKTIKNIPFIFNLSHDNDEDLCMHLVKPNVDSPESLKKFFIDIFGSIRNYYDFIYDLINNYEFSNCYETNDSIICKLFDKN
jgi:hypothetical protein